MINNFQELYDQLIGKLTQYIDDKNRDTVDLLRQEIRASEKRVKDEVISAVGEMIDGNVAPQIDDHETRIVKLENTVNA